MPSDSNTPVPNSPHTLVVGDLDSWALQDKPLPVLEGFEFADINSITPSFIRQFAPDLILSTLVTRDYDVVEIARILANMEYQGAYRVLVNNIPDTSMILEEIRSVSKNLDFDVIDMKALFSGH